MRWYWTVDDGQHSPYDVIVDGEPDSPIEEFATALGLSLPGIAVAAGADLPASDAAPESGSVLPLRHHPVRVGEFGVRFRGGPLAGQIVPVAPVSITIGRASENDLLVGDPSVSRFQAELRVDGGQPHLLAVAGARPVRVNGAIVPATGCSLATNDLVEIGSSVLTVGLSEIDAADVRRDGRGDLAFNRPSRIRARREENRVVLPGPRPDEPISAPVPWAMATVPVVLGGVMAVVAHAPAMLLMAVASPVMVLMNYRSQRSFSAKRGRTGLAAWVRSTEQAYARLAELTATERAAAWSALPDPACVREWCTARGSRLWERRQDDPDGLVLRLGVAEQPVPVTLDGRGDDTDPEPAAVMSPVPVGVDLRSAGVVGIAAPGPVGQGLARWVALQLAALRSPRDLRLVVLCDWSDEASWRWTLWLPHARTDAPNAPAVLIGNTAEARAARLGELAKLIEERQHARTTDREARFSPDVVVVVDGARRSRDEAGMATVLREGPSVGVYAVCLDDDRVRLPEEANAELVADQSDPTLGMLEVAGHGGPPRVLLDAVSPDVAEECARALAPITHVGGYGDSRSLPATARAVDLLEVNLDDPDWLATRWALGGRSTRAVIGAGLDGPFAVDLRLDGPHALVAGTTGAGKSEFLQTLVTSLALGNRPDALQFVLVDYKGASAFADCARLPHVVGMVTNLDNRETERALQSLDAELVRRERVLKDLGAKDVDDAWDRDPVAAAAGRLARLVLVIDEFAELVHELPDFVTGLIRIARVGRSLGIHLVLATQRPAGVVSAEMQANLALRIALRMADKENSSEVLGAPDAAAISPATPGRGFVRRASGAAPTGFQTARVAGRRPGVHARATAQLRVYPLRWQQYGEPVPPPPSSGGAGDPDATDLHALVELVAAATERLAVPAGISPWLPALPNLITVEALSARVDDPGGLALGLLDVPDEQAQVELSYDVGRDGHVAIVGSARSGRSTVLRTVIAEVASRYPSDDVHLYCVDFGGSALAPARDLPHCGAVVSGTETDRVVRLLNRLGDEIAQRQQAMARHGFGEIGEQRAHAAGSGETPLPYVLLLLDRWEGLTAAYPLEELQVLREKVVRILREGPAVGVAAIITGDRALLSDRIASFIETRYTLRLADREDYRLAGIRPSTLPETIPPGRAYFGEPTREVQFAVVGSDASGQGQTAALREVVARVRAGTGADRQTIRPFRLDVLPTQITLEDAAALPVATAIDEAALPVLIGVGGDDLSGYRVDFRPGPGFLVAGARRSGRSTVLASAAEQWNQAGVPVLAVSPRPSPVAAVAARLGLPLITATDTAAAQDAGHWLSEHPLAAVIVDDAEAVHGTPLDDVLVDLARTRPAGSLALMVAAVLDEVGTLLRGVAVEAKRAKQGLLLSPASSLDGNALGPGLPRALLGRAPAGRGALLVAGGWMPIQVPIPPTGAEGAVG